MPSSRPRFPAARAAAISISGSIGRVSSICRAAVEVTRTPLATLKGKEESNRGFDLGGDAAEALEREQRGGVDGQDHRQHCRDRHCLAAGLCVAFHGCPLVRFGGLQSNATATKAKSLSPNVSL